MFHKPSVPPKWGASACDMGVEYMSRIYRIYKTKDRFIDVSAMCPSEALVYARDCGFIHGYYWDIVRV